ncbi:MAG: adenylate/guanylate cyclase domain-containing protein [Deltaproteobacteria bacterium]|nr:adenylate/guanylate cyclase domain-containing protein [Deltaproteobacteria bacterium]
MAKPIRSHLKPSPFKIGCLVVTAALCLFALFGGNRPRLLTAIDNRLTDVMFNLRGSAPASPAVVVVDIDDASLAAIGQWPWPRNTVAALVARIHEAGARVIGFDLIFAEPDRTSPKNHLDNIIDLLDTPVGEEERTGLRANPALDHDLILGETLGSMPSVLGYVFLTARQHNLAAKTPFPSCIIRFDPPGTELSSINFIQASNTIVNIEEVSQGESEGFFNAFPDPSGTIRKVPLFMALNGAPYPSLALETVRIGLGEQEATIHLSQQLETSPRGVLGVSLGERFIPTDDQGQITVNYRGPVKSFAYVPAGEILAGQGLDRLKDKYVLLGTSAAGLLDLRATPFSNIFPGVEIQATVIDNILAGDPLTHDLYTEIGMTYALVAASGLLLSALLAHAPPLAGALGGLLCLAATAGGSYLFFLNNRIIGITYPLLAIITVFLAVTLSNYFFAGREKRFLRHAFGHYVSPEVVSEIIRNPANLALSGQVRNLTVFFSDIRDFTSISEKMAPERLGSFMNRYLTAMSTVVLAHGGTVDKYIGDAIMAIWGAPLTDHEHAARAVRGALASVKRLDALQAELQLEQTGKIEIGIGLNTGDMNVGNFGSSQRFDYTVIGDNVNLASRLEGLTKVYGCRILISEATRDGAGPGFCCRFIDRVRVKGKKQPVNIFEPLSEGEPEAELLREVTDFQKAITAYQQRDFALAQRIMQALDEKNGRKLYRLYLERIDVFLHSPPPPDWDGVFIFTTK